MLGDKALPARETPGGDPRNVRGNYQSEGSGGDAGIHRIPLHAPPRPARQQVGRHPAPEVTSSPNPHLSRLATIWFARRFFCNKKPRPKPRLIFYMTISLLPLVSPSPFWLEQLYERAYHHRLKLYSNIFHPLSI